VGALLVGEAQLRAGGQRFLAAAGRRRRGIEAVGELVGALLVGETELRTGGERLIAVGGRRRGVEAIGELFGNLRVGTAFRPAGRGRIAQRVAAVDSVSAALACAGLLGSAAAALLAAALLTT